MIYILIIFLVILFLVTFLLVFNHKEEKDCTAWVIRKSKTLKKNNFQKIKF